MSPPSGVAGGSAASCPSDERMQARRTGDREMRRCPFPGLLFVYKGDQRGSTQEGDVLRYALLIYNNSEAFERRSEEEASRVYAGVAEVLQRPEVTGWLRLQDPESATTMRYEDGRTLLTDGPFVDSKDFLGGFIVVEAENLDGAIAVAARLQELRMARPIEIRPISRGAARGA